MVENQVPTFFILQLCVNQTHLQRCNQGHEGDSGEVEGSVVYRGAGGRPPPFLLKVFVSLIVGYTGLHAHSTLKDKGA